MGKEGQRNTHSDGNSGPPSGRSQGVVYDRFQLYDPDNSEDMEDENIDPDVRHLLVGRRSSSGGTNLGGTSASDGRSRFRDKCFSSGICALSLILILILIVVAMHWRILSKGRTLQSLPKWNMSSDPECDGDVTKYPNNDWSPSAAGQNRRVFSKALVSTDNQFCAHVGTQVLLRNGTAVDASIAAMICNFALDSHRVGIGSGFAMLIHSKAEQSVSALIARETSKSQITVWNSSSSLTFALTRVDASWAVMFTFIAGISGEFWGYYEAKEKYGNPEVSWESLFRPTINVCRQGLAVSKAFGEVIAKSEASVMADPAMRENFVDPTTNKTLEAGKLYTRKLLAATLERIAKHGPETFYEELKVRPGLNVTEKIGQMQTPPWHRDFGDYKKTVEWKEPSKSAISTNATLYTVSEPSIGDGGSLLSYMLEVIAKLNITKDDIGMVIHKEAEVAKWALSTGSQPGLELSNVKTAKEAATVIDRSKSSEKLQSFLRNQSNVASSTTCVVAPNGDSVVVTSINREWTAFPQVVMSKKTGLLMVAGDGEDDLQPFLPPPVMVQDLMTGDIRLVAGASSRKGIMGFRDVSTLFQVVVRNVLMEHSLSVAIERPRIYQQLMPMTLYVEEGFPKSLVDGLCEKDHHICLQKSATFPAVNAIAKNRGINGTLETVQDFRSDRRGGVDGWSPVRYV